MSSSTSALRRLKLVVAYDGTDFCGWAAQPDLRTVHRTLTESVEGAARRPVELIGASRTDSGAHARHQVVHFDTDWTIPLTNLPRAVNDLLPSDLVVTRAEAVAPNFHARFSARSRWYRYRIRRGVRDPHRTRFVHEDFRPLDVSLMHRVAQALVGRHDFRAYSEEVPPESNPVRVVESIRARAVGSEVWIDVVAQAFMRGMMRRISGALWQVGAGRRDPREIARLTNPAQRECLQWPVVLPAKGLCLMGIRYGRHPKDHREHNTNALNNLEQADEHNL